MNQFNNAANVDKQYKTDTNLSIRTQIHAHYSSNKKGFYPFLFDHYNFCENQRILELGCGNASQWDNRIHDLPNNCSLILSDISKGMISSVQKKFNTLNHVKTELINVENIPYPNHSFDIVIANHMLYHVQNLSKAMSEIVRVLKHNGTFYASTNGNKGVHSFLHNILRCYNPDTLAFKEEYSFSMQNGESILKKYFKTIRCVEYKDSLVFPEVKPVMEWIKSLTSITEISENESVFLKKYFDNIIHTKGIISIPKEVCLFIAQV